VSFLLRLIRISLLALFSRRRALLDDSVIRLRVWPNDLDLNLHMNNGRYLSLMDLGRVDVMFHSGAFKLWFTQGWQPLVAASTIRHFKSLRLGQAFEIRTRILGWDEKWIYFEQRFTRQGQLHALAAVKALMAGNRRLISTEELFGAAGHAPRPSPALPAWVGTWLKAERESIEMLKRERG
jgi:YbgC/YbaW family acyl-CoA thioester hydrolase